MMGEKNNPKQIIGRVEAVSFPELDFNDVHARIDTGARTSSIWAKAIPQKNGQLAVTFFGQGHQYFDGKVHLYNEFKQAFVASSNGISELRYKVELLVELEGRRIRANFTLADRAQQAYPVLIGRNVLSGKFIVDVKLGSALVEAEKKRSLELQHNIEKEII